MKIRSLAQLMDLANAPRVIAALLREDDPASGIAFLIRPISQKILTSLDEIREVEPPRKPPTPEQLRGGQQGDFDWDNADYRKRVGAANQAYMAAVIMASLDAECGLVPPGTAPAAAWDLLSESLPTRVINFLVQNITDCSTAEMKMVDFFTRGR